MDSATTHIETENNKPVLSDSRRVPELRFKEFDGELAKYKLDDVVSFKSGGTPSKEKDAYWDGDIPWISAASMQGKYYSKSVRTISEEGLKNGSKLALKGQLLLLVRGSMLYNKVPIGIAEKDVAFNQDLKALIPNEKSYNEFLYQWFSAKQNFLLHKVTGTGIGAGKLDTDDLKTLKLNLPTLPEQQKIASFLSAVDDKVQQLTKKKELLEHYKKGVMQQLFSGQLRFKAEDGKDYPDWEEKRLGDICEMTSSKRVYLSDYVQDGIPFYRGKEISELRLNKTPSDILYISEERYNDYKSKYGVPKKDDILVTAVGTLGNILRIRNNDPFYFKDGNLIWFRKIEESPCFVEILLQWNTRELLKTSIGSTQKALTMVELRKLKFDFPSHPEQQKIATYLSRIDTKIEAVNNQITQTQTFKKGLLQQMFV
jgi:type I restriction enzyme S subunit